MKWFYYLGQLVLSLLLAAPVQAATFNITPTTGGSGIAACASDPNNCTIQEAFDVSDNNGEDDVINLASGTYSLTTTLSYAADASENFSLQIVGVGASSTILQGDDTFQLMDIGTSSATPSQNADVAVSGITFNQGNETGTDGGALNIDSDDSDLSVSNCIFTNNVASLEAGALFLLSNSGDIEVLNNTFLTNEAQGGAGGGVLVRQSVLGSNGDIFLINNVIAGNTASDEGGGCDLSSQDGSIYLINNTITQNQSTTLEGGGCYLSAGSSAVRQYLYNNIFYNNESLAGGEDGDDVFTAMTAGASMILFNNNYSQICFGGGFSGCDPATTLGSNQGNNLSENPLFANAASNDFTLQSSSPLIDQGTSAATGLPTTDISGNPRDFGLAPDMGAYEAIPQIGSSATSLSISGSSNQTLTISNEGNYALAVSAVAISETAFDIVGGTCSESAFSLAAAATCTFILAFNGSSDMTATLTLTSDDPSQASYTVSLSGTPGSGGGSSNCSMQGEDSSNTAIWMLLMFSPLLIWRKSVYSNCAKRINS